jgi:hypothetical protein
MLDQRRIKVRDVRDRQLQHDLTITRQCIQPALKFCQQNRLGTGLVRALDRDLRLQNGHQSMAIDLRGYLELLRNNGSDARFGGQIDDRTHLGAKDTKFRCARQERVELWHRPHQTDAVAFRLKTLVHFHEGHDATLVPQEGWYRLPVHVAIHRSLKQDGANDFFAGKCGRCHHTDAVGMHRGEHLSVTAISIVRNAIET